MRVAQYNERLLLEVRWCMPGRELLRGPEFLIIRTLMVTCMHARLRYLSCATSTADPLCWHGATRARVANEYLLATERGLKEMPEYAFAFTVFHGADDTLTDPDGSRALYERSQVGVLPRLLLRDPGTC